MTFYTSTSVQVGVGSSIYCHLTVKKRSETYTGSIFIPVMDPRCNQSFTPALFPSAPHMSSPHSNIVMWPCLGIDMLVHSFWVRKKRYKPCTMQYVFGSEYFIAHEYVMGFNDSQTDHARPLVVHNSAKRWMGTFWPKLAPYCFVNLKIQPISYNLHIIRYSTNPTYMYDQSYDVWVKKDDVCKVFYPTNGHT